MALRSSRSLESWSWYDSDMARDGQAPKISIIIELVLNLVKKYIF